MALHGYRTGEPTRPKWQGRKDSNPRPSVLETDALTRLSYAPNTPTAFYPTPHGAPARLEAVAVFLANVGVNASHAVHSPLHDDGSFDLVPIPEAMPWRPPMLRDWRGKAVHLDPDFTSTPATYGDNCRRAGRAFSLRRAQGGDLIVFIARLQREAKSPGFYLVGRLEIDDVLVDVTRDPGNGWWDGNAHVRRARATNRWDSFWVFKGSASSTLLRKAVPFARADTEAVFADTRWPSHRTELQTIGSYTRAVRRVVGPGEEWLRAVSLS